MTFPIVKVLGVSSVNYGDYFIAILMGGLIIFETIADQQQWKFQNEKRKMGSSESKYKDGFLKDGLWSIVRHPNYACEQAIWITFYFFSVNATGMWINWSISGCLLLILLFKGSANFSESISASKYPAYKDYIKYVPRFVPYSKSLRKLKNKSPEQVQGL
jgi:steroid 5-alpha reductase family enzyme